MASTSSAPSSSSPYPNPNLRDGVGDVYYHLGLARSDAGRFSDVRHACLGGNRGRMTKFAAFLGTELNLSVEAIGTDKRYVLYLVGGSILVASHGMGCPSISILVHELAKLFSASGSPGGAAGVTWLRLGTCGGLGVDPGTVMISTSAVDAALQPFQTLVVLGKTVTVREACVCACVRPLLVTRAAAGHMVSYA